MAPAVKRRANAMAQPEQDDDDTLTAQDSAIVAPRGAASFNRPELASLPIERFNNYHIAGESSPSDVLPEAEFARWNNRHIADGEPPDTAERAAPRKGNPATDSDLEADLDNLFDTIDGARKLATRPIGTRESTNVEDRRPTDPAWLNEYRISGRGSEDVVPDSLMPAARRVLADVPHSLGEGARMVGGAIGDVAKGIAALPGAIVGNIAERANRLSQREVGDEFTSQDASDLLHLGPGTMLPAGAARAALLEGKGLDLEAELAAAGRRGGNSKVIQLALENAGGDAVKAADSLGISVPTFRRLAGMPTNSAATRAMRQQEADKITQNLSTESKAQEGAPLSGKQTPELDTDFDSLGNSNARSEFELGAVGGRGALTSGQKMLRSRLAAAGGDVNALADEMGISASTIRRQLGLKRTEMGDNYTETGLTDKELRAQLKDAGSDVDALSKTLGVSAGAIRDQLRLRSFVAGQPQSPGSSPLYDALDANGQNTAAAARQLGMTQDEFQTRLGPVRDAVRDDIAARHPAYGETQSANVGKYDQQRAANARRFWQSYDKNGGDIKATAQELDIAPVTANKWKNTLRRPPSPEDLAQSLQEKGFDPDAILKTLQAEYGGGDFELGAAGGRGRVTADDIKRIAAQLGEQFHYKKAKSTGTEYAEVGERDYGVKVRIPPENNVHPGKQDKVGERFVIDTAPPELSYNPGPSRFDVSGDQYANNLPAVEGRIRAALGKPKPSPQGEAEPQHEVDPRQLRLLSASVPTLPPGFRLDPENAMTASNAEPPDNAMRKGLHDDTEPPEEQRPETLDEYRRRMDVEKIFKRQDELDRGIVPIEVPEPRSRRNRISAR